MNLHRSAEVGSDSSFGPETQDRRRSLERGLAAHQKLAVLENGGPGPGACIHGRSPACPACESHHRAFMARLFAPTSRPPLVPADVAEPSLPADVDERQIAAIRKAMEGRPHRPADRVRQHYHNAGGRLADFGAAVARAGFRFRVEGESVLVEQNTGS